MSVRLHNYHHLELLDIRGNISTDAQEADKCLIAHFVCLGYNGKSASPLKIMGAPLGLNEILKISHGLKILDGKAVKAVTDFNSVVTKLYHNADQVSPVIFEYLDALGTVLKKQSAHDLRLDKTVSLEVLDDMSGDLPESSVDLEEIESDIVEHASVSLPMNASITGHYDNNNLLIEEYSRFERSVSSIISQHEGPLIYGVMKDDRAFGLLNNSKAVMRYEHGHENIYNYNDLGANELELDLPDVAGEIIGDIAIGGEL